MKVREIALLHLPLGPEHAAAAVWPFEEGWHTGARHIEGTTIKQSRQRKDAPKTDYKKGSSSVRANYAAELTKRFEKTILYQFGSNVSPIGAVVVPLGPHVDSIFFYLYGKV